MRVSIRAVPFRWGDSSRPAAECAVAEDADDLTRLLAIFGRRNPDARSVTASGVVLAARRPAGRERAAVRPTGRVNPNWI
jgi:hypothetical protein